MKIVKTTEHGQSDVQTESGKAFTFDFAIEKEGGKVVEARATIITAIEEKEGRQQGGEIVGTVSTRPNGETSLYFYSDKGLSVADGVELYKAFMQEANSVE